ncbi:hypothetical protein [Micromonospora sp. NPDC049171]|uniref:hypothetical protein n=1 Tax=Micromonospora sp. NPDC049171 TaxID=3155770 RepID=UPI0033E7BA39
MPIDTPRPPDVPQPPPAQQRPDPTAQARWRDSNEATMTRRPEKTPDTHQGRPDAGRPDAGRVGPTRLEAASPRQPGLVGADRQGVPPNADHRAWRDATHVVHETRDVNQFRVDGRVDMQRLQNGFTQEVKQLAAERKAAGHHGVVLLDVRLKNVATGKGSEAQSIEKTLKSVGAKEGILVRVSVVTNRQLTTTDGKLIAPVHPRGPEPPRPPDTTQTGPVPKPEVRKGDQPRQQPTRTAPVHVPPPPVHIPPPPHQPPYDPRRR